MAERDLIKLGEQHFAEGHFSKAESCFREAAALGQSSSEALNNLAVVLIKQGRMDEALTNLTNVLAVNPLHRDALLNFAELSRAAGHTEIAISGLQSFLGSHPDDQEIRSLCEQLSAPHRPRMRIAALCLPGLETFLGDIVTHLRRDHEVKTCYTADQSQVEETVRWSDTVWLEWANDLAVAATNHPDLLQGKRVFCRLHSYEAFAGYPGRVDWSKITDLIFVADHIRDFVVAQFPAIKTQVRRIHLMPNGVDADRFRFKPKHRGKNLAFLGSVNYKKGPMLLLHALHALVKRDSDYRLFLGGQFQDARYALYFQQMGRELGVARNLVLDGWISDVPRWLEDKHYIVCSSLLEGHPVGLLEAMACGLKPVIHNFVGAKAIYPQRFLWNTMDDLIGMITGGPYRPEEYRRFVIDHFSLGRQLSTLDQIVGSEDTSTVKSVAADAERI